MISQFKILNVIVFIISLSSCMLSPTMNNAIPLEKGKSRTVYAGGVSYYYGDNLENERYFGDFSFLSGLLYFSHQKKLNDIFSVDIGLGRLRLLEDIYQSDSLYISTFQSAGFYFAGVGLDAGLNISILDGKNVYYLSGKFDASAIFPLSEGCSNNSSNSYSIIPSLGVSFEMLNVRVFIETVVAYVIKSTPLKCSNDDYEYGNGEDKYNYHYVFKDGFYAMLHFGVSF